MKKLIHSILPLMFLLTAACGRSSSPTQTPTTTPAPPAGPTPAILADTFFFGKAYVDANGNGELDPGDPPLEGARFIAEGWGALTGKDGHATITIPGGWDEPVRAKMEPPQGSGYVLIGPGEVTLGGSTSLSGAEFLFAPPAEVRDTQTPGAAPAGAQGTP